MTIDKQKLKALAWFTEDHLDDKSATTYDPEVANRWREKGWPVHQVYGQKVMDQLLAHIESLERKNANQSESIREYQDLVMGGDVSLGMLKADLQAKTGERDQLKSENEALRKDAERYRFVRNPIGTTSPLAIWNEGKMPLFSSMADAVVDEFMAKEASHG